MLSIDAGLAIASVKTFAQINGIVKPFKRLEVTDQGEILASQDSD